MEGCHSHLKNKIDQNYLSICSKLASISNKEIPKIIVAINKMDTWLTSIDLISPFSRILFPTSKKVLRASKVFLKCCNFLSYNPS